MTLLPAPPLPTALSHPQFSCPNPDKNLITPGPHLNGNIPVIHLRLQIFKQRPLNNPPSEISNPIPLPMICWSREAGMIPAKLLKIPFLPTRFPVLITRLRAPLPRAGGGNSSTDSLHSHGKSRIECCSQGQQLGFLPQILWDSGRVGQPWSCCQPGNAETCTRKLQDRDGGWRDKEQGLDLDCPSCRLKTWLHFYVPALNLNNYKVPEHWQFLGGAWQGFHSRNVPFQ